MQGNGRLRPPIAIPATLAAFAILAGAIGPVFAQGNHSAAYQTGPLVETAFAMPRNGNLAGFDGVRVPWNSDEVAAFRPLTTAYALRIRQVFTLQEHGQFDQAARLTQSLHDNMLLGDILAERYLSATYQPDSASLRDWLREWPDLPDAGAIRHRLSEIESGRKSLQAPANTAIMTPAMLPAEQPAAASPEEADPADTAFQRNRLLDRTIQARLSQGSAGTRSALRLVAATRFPNPLYAAALRAEIAQAMFTNGDDSQAVATAQAAMRQSGGQIGLAGFVAGLASWRQGHIADARTYFAQASRAALTAASTRAGASFWCARADLRLHDTRDATLWLHRAAFYSRTFYGILSARMLDQSASPIVAAADSVSIHPAVSVIGEADVDAVAATPEGKRAFALLQVGQTQRAEMALRTLWPRVQTDAALCRSIELVAQTAGMTEFASQLATILQSRDGLPRDDASFPMPRLRPRDGFTVNPALVYALTRLESNFDNGAVSGAGAHGLMQVMPVTADFMLGKKPRQNIITKVDASRPSHGARRSKRQPSKRGPTYRGTARDLHNPGINLEVGQRYLTYLAEQDDINNDLIRLLASYNAGPSALAHWSSTSARQGETDPLLFMETLPARETRDFVHRALTYLWIYAARMDLPAPSLDTLAQGEWPRFEDERRVGITRVSYVEAAR